MKQIYFIKPTGEDGPIKIGCTSFIQTRLIQLRSDTRLALDLIALVPGTFGDERALHAKFAAFRVTPDHLRRAFPGHTEWFQPDPSLLEYIERVKLLGALVFDDGDRPTDAIVALHREGHTFASIGKMFGFSKQRAHQIWTSAQVPA